MVPCLVLDQMSLVAIGAHADWILLDGGGILFMLVTFALATGFVVSGITLAAAASLQPPPSRAKRAQQAVLCFALAALLGFGLPVFYDAAGPETQDALGSWALIWAPALAGVCGLLVHQTGRHEKKPPLH